MHDEILARPRFGSEARVDAACALRLAEKCGRREAVYVFPVFVDGMAKELVKWSTLSQMRRILLEGPSVVLF